MKYPGKYATASEWLAAGWEWRDKAWWHWDEGNRTWYRATDTEAKPYQDLLRKEGTNQFQDSFKPVIPD